MTDWQEQDGTPPSFDDDQTPQSEEESGSRGARKTGLIAVFVGVMLMVIMMLMIVNIPGAAIAALGDSIAGAFGISKDDVKSVEDALGKKTVEEIRSEYGQTFAAALDCSNLPPAERQPDINCIEGLISDFQGKDWSPIPDKLTWMVPIWQASAKRYGLPWQLLAAISAARTHFGARNCSGNSGLGFDRIPPGVWRKYQIDAGRTSLTPGLPDCFHAAQPARVDKGHASALKNLGEERSTGTASPYEAVDATFSTGYALASSGAFDAKKWEYKGGPSNNCTVDDSDGNIWYAPLPPGAGSFSTEGAFTGTAPGGPDISTLPAPLQKYNHLYDEHQSPDYGGETMPFKDIAILAEWAGQGQIPGVTMAQVTIGESGQRPGASAIDPGGTKGWGLWQITTSFHDSEVEPYGGYEGMLNPISNALVMAGIYQSSGIGAWYGIGSVTNFNAHFQGSIPSGSGSSPTAGAPVKSAKPYKGPKQSDAVSQAVTAASNGGSECYVAVINDWYELIKKYPPSTDAVAGAELRNLIVEIAQRELALGVHETNGDNVPRDKDGHVRPYNISDQWCAAFATWVWREAGVDIPAFTYVPDLLDWAKQEDLIVQDPEPGDLVIYNGGSHVGIVEKVGSNGVLVSTIEGNYSDAVTRRTSFDGLTDIIDVPGAVGDLSGYVYPFSKIDSFVSGRIDMGYDVAGSGPILAIGSGTVLFTGASGWPGGHGVVYKLDSGPYAGKSIYVFENVEELVKAGDHVTTGQPVVNLINAYPNEEIGWWNEDCHCTEAQATTGYIEGQDTPAGHDIYDFIQQLKEGKFSDPQGGESSGSSGSVKLPDGYRIGQHTVEGKVSVFGGPGDFQPVALGGNSDRPGIAIYDQSTLGDWFLVEVTANGKTYKAVLQQIDIGPAPDTGRVVDITAEGAQKMGLPSSDADFPTDSHVKATILHKVK